MEVSIRIDHLDINSTEKMPLVLRGVNVGEYSWAQYSKLMKQYMQKEEPFGSFENFICGMLHEEFNVDILTADDAKRIEIICFEKTGKTIEQWIHDKLEEVINAEN
jgi:hypothetical protein